MIKKKTRKKKEKEIQEDVIVKVEDIGEVIPIVCDEENPVSDGKEFAGGEDDE